MSKEFPGNSFEAPSESERMEFEASQFDADKIKRGAKERSPQEVQALKDRLRFVAKTLSQNFGLRLIPGQGWAAGLSEKFQDERRKYPEKSLEEFDEKLLAPEIMTYPEKDLLDRNEDYIFGVFRHEVGHLKHSDYRSLLEAQDGAKKEGYQPMDLFMIYDAWEDGRSNALEGKTSPAARRRLGSYLQEDIADALTHDFEKRPLPIQYGALCWAKGAEPFIKGFDFEAMKTKIKDEKVLKAYEETQGVLDEYLGESKGRKAFQDVLWKKGWPVFKELIDKYVEDEAKRQHEESEKGSRPQEQKESGKSQEGEKNQGSEKSSEQREGEKNQTKSGGEDQNESKQGKPSSQTKQGNPGHGGKEERSWDDLSPQEKEAYRKAAREKLTEEEREFVGRLQPKSVEIQEKKDGTLEIKSREVTEKDVEKADAEEKEDAKRDEEHDREIDRAKHEAAQAAHEAQERLKERVTGLTEKEREQYNVYYDDIRKYVNVLVDRLDEVFPPQQDQAWEGGQQRGKRIDAKKLAREVPTERGRFFETKEAPEVREAAFSLLIDVSGSMKGKKIVEALKAAILMAEAFSKKGVPFEILAFHDQLLELKGFDEDYFGKKKLEIMRVLQEVQSPNARWNDDGYAVDAASRRLQRKLLENNAAGALIVLSDGEPAPSPTHAGSEWELHDIVRKWSKQIPLIGVGIGRDMEATIKEYYDKNGLPVPDVSKLPQALLKVLSNQLSRFEKKSI
jgi:hypothetical protein